LVLTLPGLCLAFFSGCVHPDPAASSRPVSRAETKATVSVRWRAEAGKTNLWIAEARGFTSSHLRELRRPSWTETHWQKLFPVIAGSDDPLADIGLPPMLGTYRIDDGAVRFEPRFPLQSGIKYRAILQPSHLPGGDAGLPPISVTLRIPDRTLASTTSVTDIYPTATELPENLLKFYLQFSAPMSGGHIYDYIHLLDDEGKPVELPFLEIDEELWNPSMTRLTLFIDPGRIKRGVTPLEEVGPALEQGRRYTLAVDAAWPDANGAPLTAPYRKTFRVIQPDRTPIELERWKIVPPAVGSRDPLLVRFDRPMDFALAQRVIRVRRETNKMVEGAVALKEHERAWLFTPNQPWTRGAHELLVLTTLEDLAGNNIGKSFEVDLFENVERRVQPTQKRVSFEVK
jgi:hypothetical protein